MQRQPYVAGYFYPAEPNLLKKTIESFLPGKIKKIRAYGAISPHAGYEYSGPVAAAVYSSIIIPGNVVILGPAHHPIESLLALDDSDGWLTPLGEVPLNAALADLILSESSSISRDKEAHRKEHSIEVQIPFLRYFQPDLSIVPILVSYEADYEKLEALGQALARAIKSLKEDVLLVASTDMSHYISQEMAEKLDYKAISFIRKLDPRGLFQLVTSYGLTMCGFQPTAAVMVATQALGAKEGQLVKYQTSGDRTGDYQQVVGYAGLLLK
ncbi:MAG: AmmeMemoRadiSam system protein B [Acidobacteriota bacterium]|nr:AmmeMemoRadiSam system protein B [Acidobacteriota bacterium]